MVPSALIPVLYKISAFFVTIWAEKKVYCKNVCFVLNVSIFVKIFECYLVTQ
jgi:hypothetical protein